MISCVQSLQMYSPTLAASFGDVHVRRGKRSKRFKRPTRSRLPTRPEAVGRKRGKGRKASKVCCGDASKVACNVGGLFRSWTNLHAERRYVVTLPLNLAPCRRRNVSTRIIRWGLRQHTATSRTAEGKVLHAAVTSKEDSVFLLFSHLSPRLTLSLRVYQTVQLMFKSGSDITHPTANRKSV